VNRQRVAQVLTILILAAALGAAVARQNGWKMPAWNTIAGGMAGSRPAQATPQDAIYAMLDAARDGDVKKYLAAYTGAMETALRQSIAESSEAAFRKYLQDTNAALKGVAVTAPSPEPTAEDREVKVRVEYVYQDRNEAQTMNLEKNGSVWKIARVDSAERVKTLVPYGSPVQ
jgi:hypothetical protein